MKWAHSISLAFFFFDFLLIFRQSDWLSRKSNFKFHFVTSLVGFYYFKRKKVSFRKKTPQVAVNQSFHLSSKFKSHFIQISYIVELSWSFEKVFFKSTVKITSFYCIEGCRQMFENRLDYLVTSKPLMHGH